LQVGRQINSVLPYLLLWNSPVRAVRRVRHIPIGIGRRATATCNRTNDDRVLALPSFRACPYHSSRLCF
jgi:hypothetical protein